MKKRKYTKNPKGAALGQAGRAARARIAQVAADMLTIAAYSTMETGTSWSAPIEAHRCILDTLADCSNLVLEKALS